MALALDESTTKYPNVLGNGRSPIPEKQEETDASTPKSSLSLHPDNPDSIDKKSTVILLVMGVGVTGAGMLLSSYAKKQYNKKIGDIVNNVNKLTYSEKVKQIDELWATHNKDYHAGQTITYIGIGFTALVGYIAIVAPRVARKKNAERNQPVKLNKVLTYYYPIVQPLATSTYSTSITPTTNINFGIGFHRNF